MNYFAEKCNGKPSKAIEIMIEALEGAKSVPSENRDREKLYLDMGTFGSFLPDGVCAGCAATFTLMKMENISPLEAASAFGKGLKKISNKDLYAFEHAIDHLRTGDMFRLLREVFELPCAYIYFIEHNWSLRTIYNEKSFQEVKEDYIALANYLKNFNL